MSMIITPLVLTPPRPAQPVLISKHDANPFDQEPPRKVPPTYCKQPNIGRLRYTVYTFVDMSHESFQHLIEYLNYTTRFEDPRYRFTAAHRHNFTGKTLSELYQYHVGLLDDGSWGVAHGRFLVAMHKDWVKHGLLVVDFNCDPKAIGTLGILRVPPEWAGKSLFLLESSLGYWESLKEAELMTRWPDEIPGYTGTRWQGFGGDRILRW